MAGRARLLHRPQLALVALLAATLAGPAGPAAAEDAEAERLEALERALEQQRGTAETLSRRADELSLEIRALRADSIAAARQAQAHEAALTDIEARLQDLERREERTLGELRAKRRQLGGTLGALQRIAMLPPDALIAAPASPLETVRSAMLLRVAVPTIERRAAALREQLDELAELRRSIAIERRDLAETNEALAAERQRLGSLAARKRDALAAVASERQAAETRARALAEQAADLRDLLARLEQESRERAEREARERAAAAAAAETMPEPGAERAPGTAAPDAGEEATRLALIRPDNIRPFPDAGADLRMPASGRVVRLYGQEADLENASSKGISIRARPGAQVVAPYDGKVVYAGEFRRYGQILIIEHGGRYHTLLAGLDRIHAVVGQWLLAGEPVGVLGSSQNGPPELYFELRRAGQPINPLPWLANTDDKVQG